MVTKQDFSSEASSQAPACSAAMEYGSMGMVESQIGSAAVAPGEEKEHLLMTKVAAIEAFLCCLSTTSYCSRMCDVTGV